MSSLDAHKEFGPFEGRTWLNCAHQGPLPRSAVRAAERAISDKVAPHRITDESFAEVPARLKASLAALIHVPADEIIVANSASYGLHLLANGIPLRPGDEVLLMKGDFPSDILPWLALRQRGVAVRLLAPRGHVLEPDEVAAALTPRTRVLCTTVVHSFSGWSIDVEAIGSLCRDNGTAFVVNGSQAIGARPFDAGRLPIDALVSVGFKWLSGPYGTGFCWIRPSLLERLEYNQAYWLAMRADDDLSREHEPAAEQAQGAAKYDVFGTANFLNFEPWTASIDLLLSYGIDNIEAHDQRLVTRLIEGLQDSEFQVESPHAGSRRSTLVFVTHRDASRNRAAHAALRRAGVDVAMRMGMLRLSPHVYNDDTDIDRALDALRG